MISAHSLQSLYALCQATATMQRIWLDAGRKQQKMVKYGWVIEHNE